MVIISILLFLTDLKLSQVCFKINIVRRSGLFVVFYGSLQFSIDSICLFVGEGKNDDVIKGLGVVLVWGVESQFVRGFFFEVNQEGGVDYGDGEVVYFFLFFNLKVVWGSFVEVLEKSKQRDYVFLFEGIIIQVF